MIHDQSLSSYLSIDDVEGRGEIFLGEREPKKSPMRKFIMGCLVVVLVYLTLFAAITPFKNSLPVLQMVNPFNIVAMLNGDDVVKPLNTTEVFEVKAPLSVPIGAYAVPLELFNETSLKDSSISVDFDAPEVFNYTGALFELNFTVGGSQEPAIFEVYIGDSPIWRTSTPNPLGALANSSTVKNVTEFLPLFTEDSVISLQLIDGAITGVVNVTLSAVFYNDSLTAAVASPNKAIDITSIFYPSGPADYILPLSNKGLPFNLPKDSISVSIPQVAENVTSAKVKFFASASDVETTFYSCAINGPMGGPNNGPIRNLNVYLNSIFISTVSPNPVLLKADSIGQNTDASTAFTPLAAPGAFDALAYEVDLTAVLPLLWEDDSTLTIEVVSPVKSSTIAGPPSIPGPVSPPGVDKLDASKWLISGNFFAWSSDLVNSSVGDILLSDSLVSGTGILIAPPFGGIENQIVRSKTSSGIQSQLNFTFADGSLHNLTYNFNSSSKGIVVKNTKLAGASTRLVYVSTGKTGVSIQEDAVSLPIFTRNVSYSYPLTIREDKATPMAFGPATNNSLNITIGVRYKTKLNGLKEYSLNNKMNSTIDDLSYSTEVRVSEDSPLSPIPFQRKVTAENGLVTKDSIFPKNKMMDLYSFSDDEEGKFYFHLLDEEIEFLNDMIEYSNEFHQW